METQPLQTARAGSKGYVELTVPEYWYMRTFAGKYNQSNGVRQELYPYMASPKNSHANLR